MLEVRHAELLVHGAFLGGPCDGSIGKSQSYSPYDGSLVGVWAEAGWAECNAALDSAHEASKSWRKSRPEERSELLRAIATRLKEARGDLAELMALEIGKPITMSLAEVDRAVHTFELSADVAQNCMPEPVDLSYDPRGSSYVGEVHRHPRGTVLAITPYNWPINLAAHKIGPALAGGNTVVLKGSGLAGLCTLALARLIHESGCPDGVLNALQCASPLAERMVLDDRVDYLSFTGSPGVGWHLKSLVPKKPVTLELGGNAFVIVDASANLDAALPKILVGAFGYAGQICISVQHVLVHRAHYDQAIERLGDLTSQVTCGDPRDSTVFCGPVIDESAADRIMSWIAEAEEAGAKVAVGGNRVGNFIEPTLLTHCPETTRIGCEEVFGPVLTIDPFDDLGEAFARIDRSRYGIHAGLFTQDEESVSRALDALQIGGLVVEDVPTVRFDKLPYGGVKESGFGLEGVPYAFEEMTQPRSVVRRLPG